LTGQKHWFVSQQSGKTPYQAKPLQSLTNKKDGLHSGGFIATLAKHISEQCNHGLIAHLD
jgi:hypothetical protein